MAHKRKAVEAFNNANGQISAFAAARQAKRLEQSSEQTSQTETPEDARELAEEIATLPYNGFQNPRIAVENIHGDEEITLITRPQAAKNVQLSTFTLDGTNVLCDDERSLEIKLRKSQTVTVVGQYDILVSEGTVSVCGAILRRESGLQRVYAPSTQALPTATAGKDGTIIRITSIDSPLQNFDKLSSLFGNIWVNDEQRRSFHLLSTTADDPLQRSLQSLEFDQEMKKAVSRINAKLNDRDQRMVVMAVGSKSSGKSTFNRLLCNAIGTIQSGTLCLYLDLDPGQPEFGPAGQISLVEVAAPILGPSFTHPATLQSQSFRLIRSHCIAATTFRDNPEHYIACARDLFRHAIQNKSGNRTPIVVNSCGWTSGLGARIQLELVRCLAVTDIVYMDSTEDFLGSIPSAVTITIHRIPRRYSPPSSRTPAELRAMQTMAYFHHRHSIRSRFVTWIERPISTIRPWKVSYAGANPGILAILSYGQIPNAEFLAEVLNGSVVAIVIPDPGLIALANVDKTPVEDLPFVKPDTNGIIQPLHPRRSHSVGLGLVRGIDVSAKKLHLVTPLADSQIGTLMRQSIVLVRGGFDTPGWAYLEDIHSAGESYDSSFEHQNDERPWVSRRELAGIESAVWRLRHPPMPSTVKR